MRVGPPLPIPSFLTKDIKSSPSSLSDILTPPKPAPSPKLSITASATGVHASTPSIVIKPTKLALRYDQPKLILFYTAEDVGEDGDKTQKVRRRSMPIRNVDWEGGKFDSADLTRVMRIRHAAYLKPVSQKQLERMVKLACKEYIQYQQSEKQRQLDKHQPLKANPALKAVSGGSQGSPSPTASPRLLPKQLSFDDERKITHLGHGASSNTPVARQVSREELQSLSESRKVTANPLAPKLPAKSSASEATEEKSAERDHDVPSWLKSETLRAAPSGGNSLLGALPSLKPRLSALQPSASETEPALRPLDAKTLPTPDVRKTGDLGIQKVAGARPEKEVVIDGERDLNKLGDAELNAVKNEMDTVFVKNLVKPGDPGYVYDLQKSFGDATEENDWDKSDDDDGLVFGVEASENKEEHKDSRPAPQSASAEAPLQTSQTLTSLPKPSSEPAALSQLPALKVVQPLSAASQLPPLRAEAPIPSTAKSLEQEEDDYDISEDIEESISEEFESDNDDEDAPSVTAKVDKSEANEEDDEDEAKLTKKGEAPVMYDEDDENFINDRDAGIDDGDHIDDDGADAQSDHEEDAQEEEEDEDEEELEWSDEELPLPGLRRTSFSVPLMSSPSPAFSSAGKKIPPSFPTAVPLSGGRPIATSRNDNEEVRRRRISVSSKEEKNIYATASSEELGRVWDSGQLAKLLEDDAAERDASTDVNLSVSGSADLGSGRMFGSIERKDLSKPDAARGRANSASDIRNALANATVREEDSSDEMDEDLGESLGSIVENKGLLKQDTGKATTQSAGGGKGALAKPVALDDESFDEMDDNAIESFGGGQEKGATSKQVDAEKVVVKPTNEMEDPKEEDEDVSIDEVDFGSVGSVEEDGDFFKPGAGEAERKTLADPATKQDDKAASGNGIDDYDLGSFESEQEEAPLLDAGHAQSKLNSDVKVAEPKPAAKEDEDADSDDEMDDDDLGSFEFEQEEGPLPDAGLNATGAAKGATSELAEHGDNAGSGGEIDEDDVESVGIEAEIRDLNLDEDEQGDDLDDNSRDAIFCHLSRKPADIKNSETIAPSSVSKIPVWGASLSIPPTSTTSTANALPTASTITAPAEKPAWGALTGSTTNALTGNPKAAAPPSTERLAMGAQQSAPTAVLTNTTVAGTSSSQAIEAPPVTEKSALNAPLPIPAAPITSVTNTVVPITSKPPTVPPLAPLFSPSTSTTNALLPITSKPTTLLPVTEKPAWGAPLSAAASIIDAPRTVAVIPADTPVPIAQKLAGTAPLLTSTSAISTADGLKVNPAAVSVPSAAQKPAWGASLPVPPAFSAASLRSPTAPPSTLDKSIAEPAIENESFTTDKSHRAWAAPAPAQLSASAQEPSSTPDKSATESTTSHTLSPANAPHSAWGTPAPAPTFTPGSTPALGKPVSEPTTLIAPPPTSKPHSAWTTPAPLAGPDSSPNEHSSPVNVDSSASIDLSFDADDADEFDDTAAVLSMLTTPPTTAPETLPATFTPPPTSSTLAPLPPTPRVPMSVDVSPSTTHQPLGNLSPHTVAPVVSATTPAPVSALGLDGDEVEEEIVEEVVEELEGFSGDEENYVNGGAGTDGKAVDDVKIGKEGAGRVALGGSGGMRDDDDILGGFSDDEGDYDVVRAPLADVGKDVKVEKKIKEGGEEATAGPSSLTKLGGLPPLGGMMSKLGAPTALAPLSSNVVSGGMSVTPAVGVDGGDAKQPTLLGSRSGTTAGSSAPTGLVADGDAKQPTLLASAIPAVSSSLTPLASLSTTAPVSSSALPPTQLGAAKSPALIASDISAATPSLAPLASHAVAPIPAAAKQAPVLASAIPSTSSLGSQSTTAAPGPSSLPPVVSLTPGAKHLPSLAPTLPTPTSSSGAPMTTSNASTIPTAAAPIPTSSPVVEDPNPTPQSLPTVSDVPSTHLNPTATPPPPASTSLTPVPAPTPAPHPTATLTHLSPQSPAAPAQPTTPTDLIEDSDPISDIVSEDLDISEDLANFGEGHTDDEDDIGPIFRVTRTVDTKEDGGEDDDDESPIEFSDDGVLSFDEGGEEEEEEGGF